MEFSASHRLWRQDWSQARNEEVFGPDARRTEYGHNYALEVSVEGPLDEQTGMVIDLKDLKDVLESEVGARFDHRCLNDDTAFFHDRPPTAENLAAAIFELLDRALPGRILRRIRLSPTPELWVEVER